MSRTFSYRIIKMTKKFCFLIGRYSINVFCNSLEDSRVYDVVYLLEYETHMLYRKCSNIDTTDTNIIT